MKIQMSAEEKKMEEEHKEDVPSEESKETTEVPIDEDENVGKEITEPATNLVNDTENGSFTLDSIHLDNKKFQTMMNRIGKVCIIMSIILFMINIIATLTLWSLYRQEMSVVTGFGFSIFLLLIGLAIHSVYGTSKIQDFGDIGIDLKVSSLEKW